VAALSGERALCEQLFHPFTVSAKPADHFVVDHQGSGHPTPPLVDQLIAGGWIGLNILALEGDAFLPKELFGGAAIPSPRLMVQYHLLHGDPPFSTTWAVS
jgi:hypothetical protein